MPDSTQEVLDDIIITSNLLLARARAYQLQGNISPKTYKQVENTVKSTLEIINNIKSNGLKLDTKNDDLNKISGQINSIDEMMHGNPEKKNDQGVLKNQSSKVKQKLKVGRLNKDIEKAPMIEQEVEKLKNNLSRGLKKATKILHQLNDNLKLIESSPSIIEPPQSKGKKVRIKKHVKKGILKKPKSKKVIVDQTKSAKASLSDKVEVKEITNYKNHKKEVATIKTEPIKEGTGKLAVSIKKKKLAARSLEQAKQKETITLVPTGNDLPPPRPKLPAPNLSASDIEILKKIRQIDSQKKILTKHDTKTKQPITSRFKNWLKKNLGNKNTHNR
jgi:hypothetical protein